MKTNENIQNNIKLHGNQTNINEMKRNEAKGGVSTRCRIEKKEENRERTQPRRHPKDFPAGSVRKSCNEKRRSQPSELITARKIQR